MSLTCYKCETSLSLPFGVNFSRTESCRKCLADLHCCKMCLFYDPAVYNECREPLAERITEKEKANFCDYFRSAQDAHKKNTNKKSLTDMANALFKDPIKK